MRAEGRKLDSKAIQAEGPTMPRPQALLGSAALLLAGQLAWPSTAPAERLLFAPASLVEASSEAPENRRPRLVVDGEDVARLVWIQALGDLKGFL